MVIAEDISGGSPDGARTVVKAMEPWERLAADAGRLFAWLVIFLFGQKMYTKKRGFLGFFSEQVYSEDIGAYTA